MIIKLFKQRYRHYLLKKISIPYKIKQDYQFNGLLVEKVRYSDGSIKTY